MSRISARFAALKAKGQKAFISFTSAGDPDFDTFEKILHGLPAVGVDLIEIGMPFSDPVADGPAIEEANLRAFSAGITMAKIFDFVAGFRAKDRETPIVLMGYANPIYTYGLEKFVAKAQEVGVDGLIIADLPPEEDGELRAVANGVGIDLIRLVTPTTDKARLGTILDGAGGFLYYVSVAGITGTKAAEVSTVREALTRIRAASPLPVGVGFGIATPEQAGAMAAIADAVIVGSAIVKQIKAHLDAEGRAKPELVNNVLGFVASLAQAAHRG